MRCFITLLIVCLLRYANCYTTSLCRLTDYDKDPHDWQQLLPFGYSAMQTPSSNSTGNANFQPDLVYNAMEILDIDDVDEAEMWFGMQFFLVTIWTDYRLNTSQLRDLPRQRLLLPDEAFPCFWAPSIIFDNDRDEKLFTLTFLNSMMTVYLNHTVVRASRCSTDLAMYPIDEQVCHFRMRLIDESDLLVQLRWIDEPESPYKGMVPYALAYSDDITLIKYKLGDIVKTMKTRRWLHDTYTYLCIRFPFIRRLTSSIVTIYLPSSLTVITSWVSFWIDIDAVPARTTLGLMSILTIITQILDVRKILPAINCICLLVIHRIRHRVHVSQKTTIQKGDSVPTSATGDMRERLSVDGNFHHSTRNNQRRNTEIDIVRHDFVSRVFKTITTIATFTGLNTQRPLLHDNESSVDNCSKYLFPIAFTIFSTIYGLYYYFLAFGQQTVYNDCD